MPHSKRQHAANAVTTPLYEFKADIDAYLTALGLCCPMRSLADRIAFNEARRSEEKPYFGRVPSQRNGASDSGSRSSRRVTH
jgi:hypothetical protein